MKYTGKVMFCISFSFFKHAFVHERFKRWFVFCAFYFGNDYRFSFASPRENSPAAGCGRDIADPLSGDYIFGLEEKER